MSSRRWRRSRCPGVPAASPGVAVRVGDETVSTSQGRRADRGLLRGHRAAARERRSGVPDELRARLRRPQPDPAGPRPSSSPRTTPSSLPPSYDAGRAQPPRGLEASFRAGPRRPGARGRLRRALRRRCRARGRRAPARAGRRRPAPTTRPSRLAARTPSRSGCPSTPPTSTRATASLSPTPNSAAPTSSTPAPRSALSANAVNAEKASSDEGPDPTYTATLPSSQRCG